MRKLVKSFFSTVLVALLVMPVTALAVDSAAVVDAKVDDAIKNFDREVNGSEVFLGQAAGYLVFPRRRRPRVRGPRSTAFRRPLCAPPAPGRVGLASGAR